MGHSGKRRGESLIVFVFVHIWLHIYIYMGSLHFIEDCLLKSQWRSFYYPRRLRIWQQEGGPYK